MEKDKKIMNLKWIILSICLICFVVLTYKVLNEQISKLDTICYEIISNLFSFDFATKFLKFVTNFGSAIFLIIITIVLFILIKNKKIGLTIIFNLIIITAFNLVLKYLIKRTRPIDIGLIEERGYSFPSGHSMVSTAFYGLLIYIIYKNIKNKYLKWSLIFILSILICFIGISRIYLGVHYTSDVIAGFLISISYLILYITVIKNSKNENF